MRSGRKPTRAERKMIVKAGLDSWSVLVLKEYTDYIVVMDRATGRLHEVPKQR